jgi:hypothetical protein
MQLGIDKFNINRQARRQPFNDGHQRPTVRFARSEKPKYGHGILL